MASATASQANPANLAALEKHLGPLLPAESRGCGICHVSDEGHGAASLDEFPHNPFGDQLRELGERWIEAGRDDGLVARFRELGDDDSDEDGLPNLQELLLGRRPGKAEHEVGPPDETRLSELMRRYRVRINRYPWRPFKPVRRPPLPNPSGDWGNNPIDVFVAAGHQQHGLHPRPEATPEQLARRVYVDLVGLTPTAAQVRRFVAEYRRDRRAYSRLVDRLLGHPAYGERWARHWMDIWRYSDWAGYKDALRESQRHIWHWRDWIVESLNQDKGYDRMVVEMLAADELPDRSADLRATGFLARNYFRNRDQWMDNVVKHTSQALLGITLGCAKCHDHMTDPLDQEEYYAFRAIFEPYHVNTDRVPGQWEVAENGVPRVYDRNVSAKTYLFERGDERYPVKDTAIQPGTPAALGGDFQVDPVSVSYHDRYPDRRPFVVEMLLRRARQRVDAASDPAEAAAAEMALRALRAEVELEAREADGWHPDSPQWKAAAEAITLLQRQAQQAAAQWGVTQAERALAKATAARKRAANRDGGKGVAKKRQQAKQAEQKARQALTKAREQWEQADERLRAPASVEFERRKQQTYPATSSGRRLGLARWLTDRQNPLAARVAVNHVWLRHFGRALVPTVNDFGAGGRLPTHPALLDWLAAELMESDWSLKGLHRLIVTSATYRLASNGDGRQASIDAENRFYWRANVRRMEGEIVRDNLLHVAGRLNHTMGGPDIDHQLAQSRPRRSLYFRHAHEKLVPFVQIFDGPSVTECYRRETSIQPHQALAMVNSKLTVDAAERLLDQLDGTGDNASAFIRRAYLQILGRLPRHDELQACSDFLNRSDHGRYNLLVVLLNHNDFVTLR